MLIFSDSEWNDISKAAEYLLREYPKILLANLRALQDIHPNTSKIELYEIVIKGHAAFIGIPLKDRNDYAKEILYSAEKISNNESIPLCFRVVVLSLISQLFMTTAQTSIWDIIPEDL